MEREEHANGGNCLVSWQRVQRPIQFGRLGIHDLTLMGWALRIRWLWLQKTNPTRPWAGLHVQVHQNARAFFAMAMVTSVGDGSSTKFWSDRWIQGKTIAELAPNLVALVPQQEIKKRTVEEGLDNRRWVSDIRGVLSASVLDEYLQLWELLEDVHLQQDAQDQHIWKLSRSGAYSSKSAYNAFFVGTIRFAPWKRIWKSWALWCCKFFIWLAALNRCWTADRLAKRGLPHPASCTLCDQAPEIINHLLVSCVVAQEIWFSVLQKVGL